MASTPRPMTAGVSSKSVRFADQSPDEAYQRRATNWAPSVELYKKTDRFDEPEGSSKPVASTPAIHSEKQA